MPHQPMTMFYLPIKSWSCFSIKHKMCLHFVPFVGTDMVLVFEDLLITHGQHHGCWWKIYVRQCTGRNGIVLVYLVCSSLCSTRLNSSPRGQSGYHLADDSFKNIFIFLMKNYLYLDSNFTKVCSLESNWQWVSIVSVNGLALRGDEFIWTELCSNEMSILICKKIYRISIKPACITKHWQLRQ